MDKSKAKIEVQKQQKKLEDAFQQKFINSKDLVKQHPEVLKNLYSLFTQLYRVDVPVAQKNLNITELSYREGVRAVMFQIVVLIEEAEQAKPKISSIIKPTRRL